MKYFIAIILAIFPGVLSTQNGDQVFNINVTITASKQIDCGTITLPVIYPDDSVATRWIMR